MPKKAAGRKEKAVEKLRQAKMSSEKTEGTESAAGAATAAENNSLSDANDSVASDYELPPLFDEPPSHLSPAGRSRSSPNAQYQSVPTLARQVVGREPGQSRRERRLKNWGTQATLVDAVHGSGIAESGVSGVPEEDDGKFVRKLAANEDEMCKFMHSVNEVYHDKLKKPPPFMRYILLGLQSTGKSTVVERILKFPMNIVAEGTGTRCPLYVTCMHDEAADPPECSIEGCTAEQVKHHLGEKVTVNNVFDMVTKHNKMLNGFSPDALRLTVKSKRVQNMMFVDLPGIITTRGKGADNRDGIKSILKSEMAKPHTKLLVLLEPKEFATNSVIDFIDETLGSRESWIDDATFFMTKFDLRIPDSKTGSKTNAFFRDFQDNGIVPFTVITPTMAASPETMKLEQQYAERQRLLDDAADYEREHIDGWLKDIDRYFRAHPSDELLDPAYRARTGFETGLQTLRKHMLEDTVRRLPAVLKELRRQLKECELRQLHLKEQTKYNDAKALKHSVSDVIFGLQRNIFEYLDGSLRIAKKFPDKRQTLSQELEDEEESEWAAKELNHHTHAEETWRDHAADMKMPDELQSEVRLLGGKQYQRAIQFFRTLMIDQLPEPFDLKPFVATATGCLRSGLNSEDWEHATAEIIKHCIRNVTHPGINFFVKHVGSIFRRLFSIALEDAKQGEALSAAFQLLPPHVENWLAKQYDALVWDLMMNASKHLHFALEPMYTTVNPNLPAFAAYKKTNEEEDEDEEEDDKNRSWYGHIRGFFVGSDGKKVKKYMHEDLKKRWTRKNIFLPAERSLMITGDETDLLLRRSFEYIISLMNFNLHFLEFSFNHYLYVGFKEKLKTEFGFKLITDTDWDALVRRDDEAETELDTVSQQINGLRESLELVHRIQRNFK